LIVLGIDPGLSGGLAMVSYGMPGAKLALLGVAEIPTTGEKAKRRVDVGAIIKFIQDRGPPHHAVIERAQAMPEQGSSSGFHYGRAVGALEATVEGMLIPHMIVEVSAWKKANGLIGRGKEDSRQRAIKLFPGTRSFDLKGDHNKAEAALLAWYGLMLLGANRTAA
jgi:Holliday junction resolvasome RuvABC endonuclease subunit